MRANFLSAIASIGHIAVLLLYLAHNKVDQEDTSPAGIVDVTEFKVWNPSSSGGIPNSSNLASYTLIASL